MTNSATPPLSRDLLRLVPVLLVCFWLLLGVRPLSVPDEGRYPEVAREMLVTGDFITPKVNGIVFLDKPALYYWLEAGAFAAFGVNPWSVRVMPALFGVLGVVAVFITARRLFGRRAAWWSALVLATSPLYFLSSQYADMNIEIAVLVTAALCLFLLARREPVGSPGRRWRFWAAWAVMGLGILTKGLIGAVFPMLVAGVWVVSRWRWDELKHWYIPTGALIMLAVCAPWYVLVQLHNPQFLHYFFIYQQFDRFSGGGFNNEMPFWFYLPVIIVGLLAWSLLLPGALRHAWRQARDSAAPRREEFQLLLWWPPLILVFFSIPASKIVGYILPVLPPLAMLAGIWIDHLLTAADNTANRFSRRVIKASPLVGVAFIITAIAAVAHYDRSGIRPLARALETRMRPGDTVVSYHYYFPDLPMYLQNRRPLPVVDDWQDPNILKTDNWRREFYYGLRDQPEAKQWLLDEARFADLLKTHKNVFVIARTRAEQHLATTYHLHAIAHTKKAVLMGSATQ